MTFRRYILHSLLWVLSPSLAGCASAGRGPGPELWFGSYVRITTSSPAPASSTGILTRVTSDSVELVGPTRTIGLSRGRITGLAVSRARSERGSAVLDGAELGAGIGILAGGIAAAGGDGGDGDVAKGMAIGGAAGAAVAAGVGALRADHEDWYVLDPRNLDRLVDKAPARRSG